MRSELQINIRGAFVCRSILKHNCVKRTRKTILKLSWTNSFNFQFTMYLGKGNDCLKSEEGEKGLWDVIRSLFQEWNIVVRKFCCWPKQTLGWAHSCCCQWWGVWSWCCCCPWTEWAGFGEAVGPRSWWSKEAKKQLLPKLRFKMRVTL